MTRAARNLSPARISLVPLIDVLFILLVYFMVTSVYLDLDMIPVVEPVQGTIAGPGGTADGLAPVLLRIDGAGRLHLRGMQLAPADLEGVLADSAERQILILPSGRAPLQALATILDTAARVGAGNVSVLRLEGRP